MKKTQIKNIHKLAFIGLVLNIMSLFSLQAQVIPPMPAAYTTAPAGYKMGGKITMQGSQCSEPTNPNAPVKASYFTDNVIGQPQGVQYVFDYSDKIDITAPDFTPVDAGFSGTTFSTTQILTPGVHWILQIASVGGQKYLACRTAEVIRKDPPVAQIYTCNGSTVTIKIDKDDANKHNKYKIEWGDGSEEQVDVTANTLPFEKNHNYTGKLEKVTLTGSYIRGGYQVCTTNPVTEDPSTIKRQVISSLLLTNGGAELSFKNYLPSNTYTIQVAEDNGVNYTWIDKGTSADGKFSITGLKADAKYCYRVITKDICGNDVASNTVCDINISATQASSSEASVVWSMPSSPSGIPQQLELLRDVEGCDNCLQPLSLFSNLDKKFEDESLDCNKIYNYQLTARYAIDVDGNTEYVTIVSEKLEVNPMDASKKIVPNGLIQAGFPGNDDSMIRLVLLDNSDADEYRFFHKGVDDSKFEEIGKSISNSFNDIAIQANSGSYCYKYQVQDACGIESDISPEFCTVFLSYKGNTLNWTDFSFPNTIITSTPAEYTVESYDEDIGTFLPQFRTSDLTQGVGLLILNSTKPSIKFRILAQQFVDIPGFTNFSIPSYSNTVEMPIPADIFIPSAFSPNGDGDNDTFEINSKFVENGTITIYDRWGSILYTGGLDGNGWDGSSSKSNTIVPIGNYSYRIKGSSSAGEEFDRSGIVTLLK